LDLATLQLPSELQQRLVAAAENNSHTELKAVLQALSSLNPEGARLAEVLRPLALEFDLDRIREIVRQLNPKP
jgi:hypothetical protein